VHASYYCTAATDVSIDRLPTVSASEALQNLHARGARTVPTGLTQLNRLLAPPSLPGHDVAGGYARGKVTEVYGPSGVGKTSLLLQAASNALHEGQHVYWIGMVHSTSSMHITANDLQMVHVHLWSLNASTICSLRQKRRHPSPLQTSYEATSTTLLRQRLRTYWRCSYVRPLPSPGRARVLS